MKALGYATETTYTMPKNDKASGGGILSGLFGSSEDDEEDD
jgi:hypothetical protein